MADLPSRTPPFGYRFVWGGVDDSEEWQCWETAIYQNGKGEHWACRWPISRERAANLNHHPFKEFRSD